MCGGTYYFQIYKSIKSCPKSGINIKMTIKLPTWTKVFSLSASSPYRIENYIFLQLNTIEIAAVYWRFYYYCLHSTHIFPLRKVAAGSCLKNALTGSWKRQFGKFICFCLQLILCRNKLKQNILRRPALSRDAWW